MHNAESQSEMPTGALMRVPGPDSDVFKTLQTILGVLSIYWKPLRTLVSSFNIITKVSTGLTS